MNGHPALAYLVAQSMLDERRQEARAHRLARQASRARTIRLGSYRLSITKEMPGVPRPV